MILNILMLLYKQACIFANNLLFIMAMRMKTGDGSSRSSKKIESGREENENRMLRAKLAEQERQKLKLEIEVYKSQIEMNKIPISQLKKKINDLNSRHVASHRPSNNVHTQSYNISTTQSSGQEFGARLVATRRDNIQKLVDARLQKNS